MIRFNEVVTGPIVLYMSDVSGYGDISLAVKITRFLIKKYPHAVFYIICHPGSFKKIHDIFPEFLDKKTYPNLKFYQDKQEITNFDVVQLEIETAICSKALEQTKSIVPHPKIFIGDYGTYKKNPYKSSVINISGNVGKNCPGILIEEDLLQFSQLKTREKNKARIKILEHMQDLQLKLQILTHKGEDKANFFAMNNFSFAYYNYPNSYRRLAIIFAASNRKKHANYFVSASDDSNKDDEVLQLLHDECFTETLKKLGYHKVIFYDKKSAKSFDQLLLDPTKAEGREFRIFQRARFSHVLTLDLMRLSELCGVAGGQSLTEAISLGLVPIPEEWQCQFNIIDQIAKKYYGQTVMANIYNKTWRKQRKTDVHFWIEAGQTITGKLDEIKPIFAKIQQESNLYDALENKLNKVFASNRYQK